MRALVRLLAVEPDHIEDGKGPTDQAVCSLRGANLLRAKREGMMDDHARGVELDEQADSYAEGYLRGYDVATARAESRVALGLPIERGED